jgi:hypothetical protein
MMVNVTFLHFVLGGGGGGGSLPYFGPIGKADLSIEYQIDVSFL